MFEELAKIKAVDVVPPIRYGGRIRRRCVSQPSDHQAILLQRLGLNLPKNLLEQTGLFAEIKIEKDVSKNDRVATAKR